MQFRRNQTGAILVVMSMLAAMPVLAGDVIDDPTQIDERATQLIQASNSLCWEMHRFHQQQPHYRESYRAAKELWPECWMPVDLSLERELISPQLAESFFW